MRRHLSVLAVVALMAWSAAGSGEEPMLRGRVLDERGRPVAGAEVYREWDGISCAEIQRRREEPEKTATDRDGRFSFPVPHPGEVHLEVFAPGLVAQATPKFRLSSGNTGVTLEPFTLERGAAISGSVSDASGRPLAGVSIWVHRAWPAPRANVRRRGQPDLPDTLTDSEGRFEVSDLRPGEVFGVRAGLAGRSSVYTRSLEAPLEEPLALVLHDLVRIEGQVIDETGAALAGEAVLVILGERRDQGPQALEVDEAGRFVVPEVEVGGCFFTIEAEGFVTEDVGIEVEPGETVHELVVTLRRAAELAGRVTLASGEPLAGVWVWVEDKRPQIGCGDESGESPGVTTDTQGTYHLRGVPPGEQTVYAHRPSANGVRETTIVGPGVNRLDFVLPLAYTLTGRVVDEHGRPVSGATVVMSGDGVGAQTYTAADGSFESLLADGEYRLRIYAQGYAPFESAAPTVIAGGPVAGLEIRFQPPAALSVRVDGVAAEELSKVLVSANGDNGRSVQLKSDGLGSFTVSGLEAGAWTVRAYLLTQERLVGALVLLESGATESVDLEVKPGLPVRGRATLDGRPLYGAVVVLEGIDRMELASARTGNDGHFLIASLSPGRYRATVHHLGRIHEIPEVEIRAGEELSLDFSRAPSLGPLPP